MAGAASPVQHEATAVPWSKITRIFAKKARKIPGLYIYIYNIYHIIYIYIYINNNNNNNNR